MGGGGARLNRGLEQSPERGLRGTAVQVPEKPSSTEEGTCEGLRQQQPARGPARGGRVAACSRTREEARWPQPPGGQGALGATVSQVGGGLGHVVTRH